MGQALFEGEHVSMSYRLVGYREVGVQEEACAYVLIDIILD